MTELSTRKSLRQTDKHKTLWFVFFIFPVVSFLMAIKNVHLRQYRSFILLFGILYGFTFIPIPDSDGDRYAKTFKTLDTYNFKQYTHDITNIYSGDSQYPDIYVFTLIFMASRISNNPQVFHLLSAFFYFLVYIGLMASVRAMAPAIRGRYYLWFFLGCVFIMNFSAGINGVRFAPALMLFSFGALNLIIKKDFKYLIVAALSALVHFSLLYPTIFLLIYYLSGYAKKPFLLYIFLILAVATTLFSDFIVKNIGFFGPAYESYFAGYTGETYFEGRIIHASRWHWYIQLDKLMTSYFFIIATLISKLTFRKLVFDDKARRLYSFAIIMIGASIISGALVDPISNRYVLLSNLFSLIYLFYLSSINPFSKKLKTLSRIYIPFFILHALIIFRGDLATVSPYLIFGNPILMLFLKSDISIQSLIFG